MSLRGRLFSFRARFLLIVLGAAVLPVLVLGVWLTRHVARSGEELVRGRLEAAVNVAAEGVAQRWALRRSLLLDVVETPVVRRAVAAGTTVPLRASAEAPPWEEIASGGPLEGVQTLRLLDAGRRTLSEHAVPGRGAVVASVPMLLAIHDGPLGDPIGAIEVRLAATALLPDATPAPGGMSAILGLYDPVTLAPLVPLPFEVGDDLPAEVEWGGERWLTAVRRLDDPPLVLVAAAPVSPFAGPFRTAAREATAVLAVAGLAAFLLAVLLTTRMTRSLGRLAAVAEAVATTGDLDLRVEEVGEDEVSRVGRAFNRMTASLRDTLQELADHRALAAVGEFAASLAHEIRNPLSAVRLDLQVVEEELPDDSSLRTLQRRALAEIERMDATLAGALQTARSGRYSPAPVRLEEPLEAAVAAVRTGRGRGPDIVWETTGGAALEVPGDAGALRQLFLNLLLNAVQAADTDGRVVVRLQRDGDAALVEIADDGPGLPAGIRSRIFEPLVSGRPGGTGLGLSIADRIARAHGGSVELADAPAGGTAARVRLPLYRPGADAPPPM